MPFDPELMQKMMMYGIPAMVAVFTYQFPAGVGIYWLVGTLFMISQQYAVNRIFSSQDAKKSPKKEIPKKTQQDTTS